ncbi:EcsC family protein [Salipaludibacillus aurantiacus]|uniref:EcsC protein family protein n=1 Tax=Salipaludibacillus aurantiacus TaxID=1601833 RepID=A0A1H9WPB2_9BACI|nr:EcsC family protein [Salipaludibacillus aurantiacus]SES35705.1 EcsC protein family protein [Salipaludibacillus aurantiacus]
MELTEREKVILKEIQDWEQWQFSDKATDFSRTYQKWAKQTLQKMNPQLKKRALTLLDETLFYLQSTVQQARFDQRAIDYLFTEARVFHPDISEVKDMKKLTIDQLRFIAKKQLARQNLLAFGQGGVTGAGGLFVTFADLPLLLAINLRSVQLTAMTYGYDMRKPYEMMLVLKVFHAVSLPRELQKEAWEDLYNQIPDHQKDALFYEGEDDVLTQQWIQQPLKQIMKLMFLRFARKKVIQGIPVAGIALGAGMNYTFTKGVSQASHYFYQKRHLQEKTGDWDII